MSNQRCFRQHARVRIDRAISQCYQQLGHAPFARASFSNLLHQVRARSSLLRPTGDGSQQVLALQALRNIAWHHRDYLEWPSTWPGGEANVHVLIHSLASHLFGRYPVPRGLGLVWFGGQSQAERAPRRWFIEHAGGRRFRDIADLPMKLTRKMESILLRSPPHLPLRAAMRRAEILGLGGAPELVEAVLATPLARDLEHGDFWRSAMHFFVNHWQELDGHKLGLLVDYLYAVRVRTGEIVTLEGIRCMPPMDPSFTLAGRTPASLLQQISTLGCQVASVPLARSWPSIGLPGLRSRDPAGEWQIVELLSAAELREEGQTMQHCVAGYWRHCVGGRSSIWSLRCRPTGASFEPRVTLEVRKSSGAIVQIRGQRNQRIGGPLRELIEQWAALAGLAIPEYAW